MSKDNKANITTAINLLTRLVESDTEVSTIDLNLLENLNTNQSLNYIKLEQQLNNLENNAKKYLKLKESEFKEYCEILSEIDNEVGTLELVTKEMDKFSKELELQLQNQG